MQTCNVIQKLQYKINEIKILANSDRMLVEYFYFFEPKQIKH